MARMLLLVVMTSLALISMMFLLMVRVNDPLVPRAIFGVLNTVLFFPSGAVYPSQLLPAWMKVIAVVDPFTYAVHGFKELILKNTGLMRDLGRPGLPRRLHPPGDGRRHPPVQADPVALVPSVPLVLFVPSPPRTF